MSEPTAPSPAPVSAEDEVARRHAKLEKLTEKFGNPFFITKFPKSHDAAQIKTQFEHLASGEKTETEVFIAGRVMSSRNNGMFVDLLDASDKIQVFHNIKHLSPEQAEMLSLVDLGDIIGVRGLVRRTPRGEITVDSEETKILSKALLPPPEKFHGLKDVDYRFRHREQDIATNMETRNVLRARFKMIAAVRQYLFDKGYLEVETPMLHSIAGGAIAKPFVTHHNALDIPLYLRIAPELHLKRLVIGGVSDKVFEINRCFRNEGMDTRHNPEFTTLELYHAYVNFETIMEITENIVAHACQVLNGTTKVTFGDKEIDFTPPWPRKGMTQLIKEHTGVDFDAILAPHEAYEAAKKIGVFVEDGKSWGQVVEAVFGEKVEESLIQPTHVVDLPKEISPLSKAWPDRPNVAQRFETYVNGWEIANAFSELNDPREQKARFLEQAEQKRGPDEPPHPIDQDFIDALAFGMPPMGGLGVGMDRLAMLLTNSQSIREIIAFPTMRPE
jgi:lysyl-tRNA synthetase class 2